MTDDLQTLWVSRDKTDGRMYPLRSEYGGVTFPFTRAKSRTDLPMFRRKRFYGVIGETWYEAQDFPSPDFYWDNPTHEEYERVMAPYLAQLRREKIEAIAYPPLAAVTVLVGIILLPFALFARLMRWAYR